MLRKIFYIVVCIELWYKVVIPYKLSYETQLLLIVLDIIPAIDMVVIYSIGIMNCKEKGIVSLVLA